MEVQAARDSGQVVVSRHSGTVKEATGNRVVAIDLGIKRDILSNLTGRGFEVDVVPAGTGAVSPGASPVASQSASTGSPAAAARALTCSRRP